MTQCDRIIQYMEANGGITAWEAMREFGCMRLAARIADLKDRGYKIVTTTEKSRNRFGEPVCFAKYTLQEDKNA